MTVLIEDSPRNLLAWITDAVGAGLATGGVVSPFVSPRRRVNNSRRCGQEIADALVAAGAEIWFDATTHALQMAGVGDFRHYLAWDLWGGPLGDLSTTANQQEHVRRVFEVQRSLGAPLLGPSLLLHNPASTDSQRALDLSAVATATGEGSWLTIAGTTPFWESGSALDAHVGALAQLNPPGWFVCVARPLGSIPVDATAREVHGLCRTVRALSEYAPVYVSHGDLAALPAIAAGATSLGTGWDQRQRVCAFGSYAARAGGDGGGWYERPTFPGLVGSLKPNEAALMSSQDPALTTRLGGLPPPGPKEAFTKHVTVLRDITTRLARHPDLEHRCNELRAIYAAARTDWPIVVAVSGSPLGADDWIEAAAAGLELYATDEGW